MGFFTGCARVLLIVFNFIFWLSGAAILGVGIWILVDPDLEEYQDVIKDAADDEEFLKVGAYILIGFGAFVFLVGFCGCCGAIRSSKCLLGFYIFFLVIVFAGELAAGIYVAIYKGDIDDKLDDGLTRSIRENYKAGDKMMTAWDVVQKELECCGGKGYRDYENSTWAMNKTELFPESCCVLVNDKPIPGCNLNSQDKKNFYEKGCRDALEGWVDDHATILIGVGCGIAALEIIGLICAICFCRHMDRDKYTSN